MSDLVERLRSDGADCSTKDCESAADEIERLRAVLDKVIVHGVWNECIHCNAKVKIAEEALSPTQEVDDEH